METTYTATFSSKGQLTFPAALRRKTGIKPGHKVTLSKHPSLPDSYTVTIHKRMSLKEAYGALYDSKRKYIPISEARDVAGKALKKKYATP